MVNHSPKNHMANIVILGSYSLEIRKLQESLTCKLICTKYRIHRLLSVHCLIHDSLV